MNIAKVHAKPPQQLHVLEKISEISKFIVQLAVRTLFIVGSVTLAASAFPIHLHTFALVTFGAGATFLSAFFYPNNPVQIGGGLWKAKIPLVKSVQVDGKMPLEMPKTAPRGLKNPACNCCFNSVVQFLNSDPRVADWFRHPVRDNMSLDEFIDYFASYEKPQGLIVGFREFHDGKDEVDSIPDLFQEFLEEFNAPAGEATRLLQAFQSKYHNLRIIQPVLSHIYEHYDLATQRNLANVAEELVEGKDLTSTQRLRVACSQVAGRDFDGRKVISESSAVQLDAEEILSTCIFDILPPEFMMYVETRRELGAEVDGVALKEQPTPKVDVMGVMPLHMDEEGTSTLEKLIELNCRNRSKEMEPARALGQDGKNHDYPVNLEATDFIGEPETLRFEFKRFYYNKPAKSWLSSLCPKMCPQGQWKLKKNTNPVKVPDVLSVQLKGGIEQKYRLTGFIHQKGTMRSGHYISGCVKDGEKYIISDNSVSHIQDEESWERYKSEAYILNYVKMNDDATQHPAPVPQSQGG